jgi:RNA polymerase sigma-70 factor (ECF subfamily)
VIDDSLVPHLDAAYNLARWLMGNEADAEDAVHDAVVSAMQSARAFRGGDRRAWLLAIVRNACYTSFRRKRVRLATPFDEVQHTDPTESASPEGVAIGDETRARVQRAIAALLPEFREVIVLRELEGMSYKEIADVISAPIGTVMSRLSRAREQLRGRLADARRGCA